MSAGDAGYVLTEIWKARPSWLALSPEERQRFFDDKVNPFLGAMVGSGAEILCCAINDNDGPERIDFRYMAVWKLADKAAADRLEAGARAMGFLDYFEQVNCSGVPIAPPALNEDMLSFGS